MRDMNQTLDELDIQLERIVGSDLQSIRLTDAVFVNPNLEYSDYRLVPVPRKLDELKALTLVSYYVEDKAVGFYLREQIRDKLKSFSLEDRLSLEILLCGKKELVLEYLLLNNEISSRTFFGNIVPLGKRLFNQLHFSRRKLGPVVKPVWRRGYKDKGTLRPITKRLPNYDYSFTDAQNEKERIDDYYQSYLNQVLEILSELLE